MRSRKDDFVCWNRLPNVQVLFYDLTEMRNASYQGVMTAERWREFCGTLLEAITLPSMKFLETSAPQGKGVKARMFRRMTWEKEEPTGLKASSFFGPWYGLDSPHTIMALIGHATSLHRSTFMLSGMHVFLRLYVIYFTVIWCFQVKISMICHVWLVNIPNYEVFEGALRVAMTFSEYLSGWWFGTWKIDLFFRILEMSSSQLTNSIIFQRGGEKPPTSYPHVHSFPIFNSYPLVNIQKNDGKSPCLMIRSTINGNFHEFFVCLPEARGYLRWLTAKSAAVRGSASGSRLTSVAPWSDQRGENLG